MDETRIIELRRSVFARNDAEADAFRAARKAENKFFVDIMASPGAGKTTLLLALIAQLRADSATSGDDALSMAVIEADLDALKIKEAGVPSVELNTRGICHVEMGMVHQAFSAFGDAQYEYLFLENIGNLVCPADFDTGAHLRVMLLSVPEGWDKVMKYPPMFAAVDALIVTKTDYLPLNPDFNRDALRTQARILNPDIRYFETSAHTGDGIEELAAWLRSQRDAMLA